MTPALLALDPADLHVLVALRARGGRLHTIDSTTDLLPTLIRLSTMGLVQGDAFGWELTNKGRGLLGSP